MTAATIDVVFFDLGDTLVVDGAWAPGAEYVLARLADAGLRVGIISNTGNLTRGELKSRLPPDFDFGRFCDPLVILSSEVGHEKPDVGIYLAALQAAGVSPEQCCYVGERLSETLGAQRAGMRAARICDTARDFGELPGLL